MSEKRTLSLLKDAVATHGVMAVAKHIGESKTENINFWINKKKIPKTKEKLLRFALLALEKESA